MTIPASGLEAGRKLPSSGLVLKTLVAVLLIFHRNLLYLQRELDKLSIVMLRCQHLIVTALTKQSQLINFGFYITTLTNLYCTEQI
jgi:hypothetical protein